MTVSAKNKKSSTAMSKESGTPGASCPQRKRPRRKRKKIACSNLERINVNAAGIDIASGEHWVCVPPEATRSNIKKFGTFTCDLHAISQWLKNFGVTTVAMESTGLYWVPLFLRLIDDGFEVFLVNAKHIKNVSGRPKTDRLDCQWIQRLHTFGLLSKSFIPEKDQWMLRAIVRQRSNLIRLCDRQVQYMQKALQQMNLLLHKVISDITGVTGLRIIDAMLAGERDPMSLANLADCRIKNSPQTIAKALVGEYHEELLFLLQQAVDSYRYHRQQILQCEQKIEKLLPKWEDKRNVQIPATLTPMKKPKQHQLTYDAGQHFYRIYKVDLTQLPGFDGSTIQTLFAEIGNDMSPWETEKHFTSWIGLSPAPDISGGKVLKNKTKKIQSSAARAFRMAALACGKTDTALGSFYRRLKARIGGAKALTATARKLALIFYRMVAFQLEFKEIGADYYMQRHKQRVKRQLERKARLLGFTLVPMPEAEMSV